MQLCGSLSILWHCLSLGLEWKLTFSSPVATAKFSRFAGILSAALSQHHLLGFEIAQLEFITSTSFVCSDAFLRPTWLAILWKSAFKWKQDAEWGLKLPCKNCKADLILSPSHISSVYTNMEVGKEKGMFGGTICIVKATQGGVPEVLPLSTWVNTLTLRKQLQWSRGPPTQGWNLLEWLKFTKTQLQCYLGRIKRVGQGMAKVWYLGGYKVTHSMKQKLSVCSWSEVTALYEVSTL